MNLIPITKTLEYKYYAVRIESIANHSSGEKDVVDEYNELKKRLREIAMGQPLNNGTANKMGNYSLPFSLTLYKFKK